MPLSQIHLITGRAFMFFALVISLFALYHYLRERPLGGDFFGAVIIGEALIVIQAILGLIALIQGAQPGRGIHLLYGTLAVLIWPATFGYTRNQDSRREALIWALISAFLFGISMRAFGTGLG